VVVTGADGETVVETAHVLIATGSEPIPLPGLPFDGERIVSSTEALALESVPSRLLVIGAGAVGLELGSVWRRLGSEVGVGEFLGRLGPGAAASMAGQLTRALGRRGLPSRLPPQGRAAGRTAPGGGGPLPGPAEPPLVDADVVLVAVGRRPYT